jgi:N-acylneuraminate cytidylyltransferase
MKKNNIAIITARGDSKRIPHKNIKLFLGKPIIKFVINAALASKCFNEVMVSTDDKEIAKISQSFGAKVPFFRSAKNSNDFASTVDVINEVLSQYSKRKQQFDYFCCIYPTAPFITAKNLKKSYQLLLASGADSAFPVVRFSYPIQRAFTINKNRLKMIQPKYLLTRSQDLKPTYHDCGQFYWVKTQSFLTKGKILTKNTIPLVISELEMQDVDNPEDWALAEIKYKLLNKIK